MNVSIRATTGALALVAFLFAAGATCAQEGPEGQAAAPATAGKDPMQQIPETLKALEAAKEGEYGKLRRDDKRRLEAADREIQSLLRDNGNLSALDEQERVRLFNAQESIMAIVSGLKRSQLICTYRQNIGTRFRTKHCVTRDIAEAQKRAAKDSTHTAQNPMCVPGEGNPCQ